MYVSSQKFGYFGGWLSDVNTLEMKNFDTRLVFICNTLNFSITNQKFQGKPKVLTFDFSFAARQSSICNRAKHTFGLLSE